MNYYELLAERATEFGDKIFLRVDARTLTYENVLRQADSAANNFVTDSENIFIASGGWLEQFIKFLAVQRLRKRPILLHDDMTAESLEAEGGGSDDVLGVLSSGSSGRPKVLFRTFDSWNGFFPTQNKIFGVDGDSEVFIHGSLSFTGNLNVALSVMSAGGTIVTSDRLNARTWLDLIDGCSTVYLVPTKLKLISELERTIESVETIFTGSQNVSERLRAELARQFPRAKLIVYYGASELNYITYKELDGEVEAGNVGRAFEGVKVEIRDGLIYVENAYHVSGLEGSVTIGDAGHWSSTGELILEGRNEDFINKGGYKISATRLENELTSIDGIDGAAVVKVSDERRGEDFAAYVVTKGDREEAAKKIRRRLKPIERPMRIEFVEELPLNDRGKVDKRALIKKFPPDRK